MSKLIVLNLGSTSTKVALFEDEIQKHSTTLRHSAEELKPYKSILDQEDFRKECVMSWLNDLGVGFSDLDLIVTRGPLLKPIEGGIYLLNQAVADDARSEKYGTHISTVGALLAYGLSQNHGIPAIFLDAVVTDELCEPARYSGLKGYERRSVFHALNAKQIARETANKIGKPVSELNLIIAHLGGGVSISAHALGKVVDVNNAIDGEGPFSPERVGGFSCANTMKLMEDYDFNRTLVKRMLVGSGGLISYLGHGNVSQAMEEAKSNPQTKSVLDAMAYQIAKEIGAMAAVLKGKVDAVSFTGGIAYNREFLGMIRQYTDWIAPVFIFEGEDEMRAMALGGLRYLRNEEKPKLYR